MKTLFALSFLLPLLACGQACPEGRLSYYEFSYSGTMAWPITYYRVELDEESGQLTLGWSRSEPEITLIRVGPEVLSHIDALVKEYRLYRLKDRYLPPVRILDGHQWSVYFRYEQDSISSHGSNAWPSGRLREGMDAVNDYLKGLIDAATEDDVIGRKSLR